VGRIIISFTSMSAGCSAEVDVNEIVIRPTAQSQPNLFLGANAKRQW
jgi:hypothetical protein